MADFEEAQPRPLVMICGTLSTKDTGAFLAHFKGLVRETIAVPIPGEHVARTAEEVAEFARRAGLCARCGGERRRRARCAGEQDLAETAARADRRLALSRRSGAGAKRLSADLMARPTFQAG